MPHKLKYLTFYYTLIVFIISNTYLFLITQIINLIVQIHISRYLRMRGGNKLIQNIILIKKISKKIRVHRKSMLWIGRSILDGRYCSGYSKYIPEYFRGTRNLLTEKNRWKLLTSDRSNMKKSKIWYNFTCEYFLDIVALDKKS